MKCVKCVCVKKNMQCDKKHSIICCVMFLWEVCESVKDVLFIIPGATLEHKLSGESNITGISISSCIVESPIPAALQELLGVC